MDRTHNHRKRIMMATISGLFRSKLADIHISKTQGCRILFEGCRDLCQSKAHKNSNECPTHNRNRMIVVLMGIRIYNSQKTNSNFLHMF